MKMLAWRTSDRASSVGGGMKMAVQRVFCVFCVSPFSYAWCVSYAWRVAYWRMGNRRQCLYFLSLCKMSKDAGESGSIGALRMPALGRAGALARLVRGRSEDGDAQKHDWGKMSKDE